jgi:hypothetical protein
MHEDWEDDELIGRIDMASDEELGFDDEEDKRQSLIKELGFDN